MVDITTRKDLLKAQGCFTDFTEEEINQLATLLTEKTFRKSEYIVIEGSRVESIYLIVSGEVEVRHMRLKNKKIEVDKISHLGPGDSIGLDEKGFFFTNRQKNSNCSGIDGCIYTPS